MKFRLTCILAAALALTSCGGGPVDGLEPVMTEVPAGTFSFGSMPDKTLVKGAEGPCQVIMSSYSISSEPVTTALWDAVMGTNLSKSKAGSDNQQGSQAGSGSQTYVSGVSAKDCDKFVAKLSKKTGKDYIIPSEQMWEYACRKGVVNTAKGIYEWCSDSFDGENRVVRSAAERKGVADYTRSGAITFRVALAGGTTPDRKILDAMAGVQTEREHSCTSETIEVNGVRFDMVAVKGGSTLIGGTAEQNPYQEDDEVPPISVELADFEIGVTEVTVRQWLAVNPVLPAGNFRQEPDKPVINVSWYAAQEFILALNEMTGRIFRLPTEYEWEFAARGGIKTSNFRYAGSNQVLSVAVHEKNSGNMKVKDVRSMGRNELGLYDMCGNAWEWCLDAYAPYGGEAEDPGVKVMRGGSAASRWDACRVSNRSAIPADNLKGTFGFRLAI